jgi:YihY family inner membrane protein
VAFVVGVIKRSSDDQMGRSTALLSYYGFLSLLPLLLVASTLVGRFLETNPERKKELLDSIVGQIPVVGDTLAENVTTLPTSGVFLLFSVLATLWAGLAVVHSAQEAFNTMWNVPRRDRPDLVRRSARGLAAVIVVGIALVITTVAGPWIAQLDLTAVARAGALTLTFVVNSVAVLILFELLTGRHLGWRRLLAGALVGGLGLLTVQLLGGLYLTRVVNRANAFYGIFAAAIGLLVWLALIARVILYAAEVNVVRTLRLWPRSLTGRDLLDADHRSVTDLAAREALIPGQIVTVVFDDGAVVVGAVEVGSHEDVEEGAVVVGSVEADADGDGDGDRLATAVNAATDAAAALADDDRPSAETAGEQPDPGPPAAGAPPGGEVGV